MVTVFVFGRCLACWSGSIIGVEVAKHLPPAFKAPCGHCGSEQQHAVTGQVVNTLSAAAMREIKGARQRKVRVQWEQLPLVPALMPQEIQPTPPGAINSYAKPSAATHDAGPAPTRHGK